MYKGHSHGLVTRPDTPTSTGTNICFLNLFFRFCSKKTSYLSFLADFSRCPTPT
jgi:hypothetical protein